MAAIDFPSSPTVGQTFTANGRSWVYTSAGVWDTTTSTTFAGNLSIAGNSTIQGNETVNGSFTAANYSMAGKNVIINGGFDIWQKGLSGFTYGGSTNADRWFFYADGTGATRAVTGEVAPTGIASSIGYEAKYFLRYAQSVAGSSGTQNVLYTKIEDVRTLAGQTVTLSFWAKADSVRSITTDLVQIFGSGGSANVDTYNSFTISTTWNRYSVTTTLPSVSGKTIGANNYLQLSFFLPTNTTQTIDFANIQLELGSVATPFSRAGGTLQGELAACQRYYYRVVGPSNGSPLALPGPAFSSTQCMFSIPFPVVMRTAPSSTFDWTGTIGNYKADNFGAGAPSTPTISSFTLSNFSAHIVYGYMIGTGFSQNYHYMLEAVTSGAYIGFSAEL